MTNENIEMSSQIYKSDSPEPIINEVMDKVHNYGERGDVENDLQAVLEFIAHHDGKLFHDVIEMLTDTEAAEDD